MLFKKSQELFKQAQKIIPGGVNSPVRACRAVGMDPLFIQSAQGAKLYDADGNQYIDFVGSWGPMILGHRHPAVLTAIQAVLARGTSFGAPVDLEVEMAELIVKTVPGIEMVRMVNSGTEAVMSAIRLARGFSGRDLIIKFDGCYHGHADAMLRTAGSGVATLEIMSSPGVPQDTVKHTLSLPYNDIETLTETMQACGTEVAAIIVEPVAGNMGLVPPGDGFLKALRELTLQYSSVLIFDEVMTGFRVSPGGAQELYNITPDITCLGKIIGGGLPVGALGGSVEIMKQMAPQGSVYQAGTLSGNPLAMAAGLATLKQLQSPGFYDDLEAASSMLARGLVKAAAKTNVPVVLNRVGSMLGLFFTSTPVNNFEDAKKSNLDYFAAYYRTLLQKGIYIAPSQFEVMFVSGVHQKQDIETTIKAVEEVL